MALSKEKIAEIQTLVHLLEIKPMPTAERITKLYEDYLSRLNAPTPANPEEDAKTARTVRKRLEDYKRRT
jgi:hypothetical protein